MNIERASEELIQDLIEIGALYIDDTGIHASPVGVYKKEGSATDR